jgi:cobalamin 5'-phosphate synthase/cobalamin synthase
VRSFAAAIAFLTRIPVGRWIEFDAADVARASGWFPFVGAILGALGCALAAGLRHHLPVAVAAVLLVALDALLTGGLHYDGLADTFDGFGGGKTREDVLRIMRDHCIGSYGGTALGLCLLLKVAAIAALLDGGDWWRALILGPALGRWSILLLTATVPYARQTTSVVEGMGKRALLWGTLAAAALVAGAQSGAAILALAFVAIWTAGFGRVCMRRIAGITGDTLGANEQMSEILVWLVFLWKA